MDKVWKVFTGILVTLVLIVLGLVLLVTVKGGSVSDAWKMATGTYKPVKYSDVIKEDEKKDIVEKVVSPDDYSQHGSHNEYEEKDVPDEYKGTPIEVYLVEYSADMVLEDGLYLSFNASEMPDWFVGEMIKKYTQLTDTNKLKKVFVFYTNNRESAEANLIFEEKYSKLPYGSRNPVVYDIQDNTLVDVYDKNTNWIKVSKAVRGDFKIDW